MYVSSASEVSRTNDDSTDASTVNERVPQLSDIESDNGFNSDDTNIESVPDSNGLTSEECDSSSDDEDISYKCVAGATKEKCYAIKRFLSATDIVHLLFNVGDKHTVDSIPDGPKENVYYILSEEGNRLRSESGKNKIFPDDCGVWNTAKGRVVKTHFVFDGDNTLKFITLREGRYCSLKQQSGIQRNRATTFGREASHCVAVLCNTQTRR